MARPALAAGLLLACLAAAPGCASLGLGLARALPDAGRECPGALRPTAEIGGDFRVRQQARVQGEGLDWRLELAVQKRGDVLLLIGLDTLGGKLFVATQRGTQVEIERPRGRLPLPPIDLLRDFHRARLLPGDAPPEADVTLIRAGPGDVTIEHPGCGYRVRLVTIEEGPLAAPAAGAP